MWSFQLLPPSLETEDLISRAWYQLEAYMSPILKGQISSVKLPKQRLTLSSIMCIWIQAINANALSHFLELSPKFVKEFWIIRGKSNLKFYVKLKFTARLLASRDKSKRIQSTTIKWEWMITYRRMGRPNYGTWYDAASLVMAWMRGWHASRKIN